MSTEKNRRSNNTSFWIYDSCCWRRQLAGYCTHLIHSCCHYSLPGNASLSLSYVQPSPAQPRSIVVHCQSWQTAVADDKQQPSNFRSADNRATQTPSNNNKPDSVPQEHRHPDVHRSSVVHHWLLLLLEMMMMMMMTPLVMALVHSSQHH